MINSPHPSTSSGCPELVEGQGTRRTQRPCWDLRPLGPRRFSFLLASLLAASCGAPLMKLPAGPGAPAPDIRDVMTEATAKCRAVSSLTVEVAVSGSIGGRRVRARLAAGLASPASARLEAFAFGQPIFIFVARASGATLLLTRGRRVLERGAPGEVLEAVAGVPLDAADLRTALLGCVVAPDLDSGRRLGDDWRIAAEVESEVYLRREARARPWRLVAVAYHPPAQPAWRAEYRDFVDDLPRAVRFVSDDPSRFDLRLTLSQLDLNVKLDAPAFEVTVPAGVDPITLDELRRQGPLAGSPPGNDGR